MKNKSLTQYFRENIAKDVNYFALCAQLNHKTGDVEFCIHPANVSGDTADFVTTESPANEDYDFIFNKAGALTDGEIEVGAQTLLRQLHAARETSLANASVSHEAGNET